MTNVARVVTWYRPRQNLQTVAVVALMLLATAIYFQRYYQEPWHPHSLNDLGWFGQGSDQTFYYRAALAWAHGNFDPSQHWYLPGYSLMGALFVWLTPLQPFPLPNVFCLALSLWLLARLTAA